MRLSGIIRLVCLWLTCGAAFAQGPPTLAEWDLRDSLGHEWTGELLYYDLTLKKPLATAQPVALFDETGRNVPVQIVERRAATLRIALITDLKPFQQKHFRLVAAASTHPAPDLTVTQESKVWRLQNSRIGLAVPVGAGQAAKFVDAPPPIMAVYGAARREVGSGWLSGTRPVVAWRSEILAKGPVFAWARVRYDFADGQSYTVDVRLPAGQPVALVREERNLPSAKTYETDPTRTDVFQLALADKLQPTHVYSKRGLGSRGYFIEAGPQFAGAYLTPAQLHFIPTACNIVGTWRGNPSNPANQAKTEFIGLFPRFLSHWTRPQETAIPLAWDKDKGLVARFFLNDGVREWGLMAGPHEQMLKPRGTGGEGRLEGYFDALLLNNQWGETPLDKVKNWVLDWGTTTYQPSQKYAVASRERGTMPYFAEQFLLGGQKWEDTYIHVHQTWTGETDAWARYLQSLPNLPPEQQLNARAAAAFVMYKQTDPDYWPSANWIGPANPNMKMMGHAAMVLGALALEGHPQAQVWLTQGLTALRQHLDEGASTDGIWLESPGYDGAGLAPIVSAALALHRKGRDDLLDDGRLLKAALAHVALMTPPDPRTANRRHLPEFGDSFDLRTDAEAARVRPTYWKDFALAIKAKQPQAAAQILWALGEAEGVPPDGASRQLTGFGAVFRHAFNSKAESYLAVHQDSFSFGHYHWDLGALYFFGLGAPLAVDWPSLYEPQINQAWMHNGVSVARMPRFAYQGRVAQSAIMPHAAYSRSQVFYDVAFPPATTQMQKPARSKGVWSNERPYFVRASATDLRSYFVQASPTESDVPPHVWQRQVLFVTGHDEQAYFVVRDAVNDERPTEWNLWTLSDKVRLSQMRADVTGTYGVNMLVNFFIGPSRTPTTEMFGFGNAPNAANAVNGETKRTQITPDTVEIVPPRRYLMQQNAIRLESARGGDYGAVIFPYRPNTPTPVITKIGNDAVTVTTGMDSANNKTIDTILLYPNSRNVTAGDVTLAGRAALVSNTGRAWRLQLLEGTALSVRNGVGVRGAGPVTVQLREDNSLEVEADGAARELVISGLTGRTLKLMDSGAGVTLLEATNGSARVKVTAGKHRFRL